MYVSLYVCMYVCMCVYESYITAFASIPSNIEIEAISCFVQKATVSRAKMLKESEGCTNSHDYYKADLFLRIFQPISGTLKRFETL